MDINQLIDIYHQQGWNDDNAIRADISAGGWKNKIPSGGGGDVQSQVNGAIQDSYSQLQQQVVKNFKDYNTSNPFNIDKIQASSLSQAKEQIDPYYNETLNDYLTGVQRKLGRGQQDTQQLLTQLNADTSSYSRDTQIKLQQAMQNAGQGYASAGLYDSGARQQNQGLTQVQSNNQLNDYLRNQDYRTQQIQQGQSRDVQDVAQAQRQQVRDIARDQFTNEQTRQSELTKEAGQKYVTGFRATLPPELQAASGFDLLQNLGVYS